MAPPSFLVTISIFSPFSLQRPRHHQLLRETSELSLRTSLIASAQNQTDRLSPSHIFQPMSKPNRGLAIAFPKSNGKHE
jgi:hypothetical protein